MLANLGSEDELPVQGNTSSPPRPVANNNNDQDAEEIGEPLVQFSSTVYFHIMLEFHNLNSQAMSIYLF